MATNFGWKRKRKSVPGSTSSVFEDSGKHNEEQDGIDWLAAAKKRRGILLEDNLAKSKRLLNEGALLAENERYWEALKYWNEALELTPGSAILHEMKSQVLLNLNEVFPAVESAERAVKLGKTWGIAWQTLGRCQLGLGQVEMALSSAQKACHIDPTIEDIWEDIKWTQKLVSLKKEKSEELKIQEEKERNEILKKRIS